MTGAFWTASRDWRTWAALFALGIFAGLMIFACSMAAP